MTLRIPGAFDPHEFDGEDLGPVQGQTPKTPTESHEVGHVLHVGPLEMQKLFSNLTEQQQQQLQQERDEPVQR